VSSGCRNTPAITHSLFTLAEWNLFACHGRLVAVADVGSLLTIISPQARAAWTELVDVLAAAGPTPCAVGPAEAWWPSRDETTDAAAACRMCPAREACLAYAVAANERAGVWGGLLPAERRRLARRDAVV
jgi:WhiB family redox-sensing transcriptional regulator